MELTAINQASPAEAREFFGKCCTSNAWVSRMVARRPFQSTAVLRQIADESWTNLGEGDYLEAFQGHPKIGDINSLQSRYAASKSMAANEQSGVTEANRRLLELLDHGNRVYESRFGFIFIIFATGKTADQLIKSLYARLQNDRNTEVRIAAEEQRKIIHLRLDKML